MRKVRWVHQYDVCEDTVAGYYKVNHFHLWEMMARWKIDTQEGYLRAADDAWSAKQEEFSAWYDQEIGKLPAEEQNEFAEHYSDRGVSLFEEFPRLHRRSLFVTCWSQLESAVTDLCPQLAHWKKVPLGFDEHREQKQNKRDRGFTLAAGYLRVITGKNLKETEVWRLELSPLGQLRNAYAHRDGKPDPNEDVDLEQWLKRNPGLVTPRLSTFELEDGFLEHVISVERAWLKEIKDAVDPWYATAEDEDLLSGFEGFAPQSPK